LPYAAPNVLKPYTHSILGVVFAQASSERDRPLCLQRKYGIVLVYRSRTLTLTWTLKVTKSILLPVHTCQLCDNHGVWRVTKGL